MYHLTSLTDLRIQDLHDTATEGRLARVGDHGPSWIKGLRLRLGAAFMTAGTALQGRPSPATTSSV